jgi:hypothetical protein
MSQKRNAVAAALIARMAAIAAPAPEGFETEVDVAFVIVFQIVRRL